MGTYQLMNQQMTTQEFLEAIDASMKSFTRGQIVSGTIVQIGRDGALVDIGHKTEAFIPLAEVSARKDANINEILSIGAIVDAKIIGRNSEEDQYILSLKEGEVEAIWNDLENRHQLSIPVIGKVIKIVKGGLIVDIGVKAFLPGSLIDVNRVTDFTAYVGHESEFIINSIDREKGSIVLNRRSLIEQMQKEDKQIEFAKLAVGQIHRGNVSGITDYGVFIEIGMLAGLIHKSKMGEFTPEQFTIGHEVEVEIIEIDFEKSRLSLALRG
jgi:small subunit ribosomal protein S1